MKVLIYAQLNFWQEMNDLMIQQEVCYASIGVTSLRNEQLINNAYTDHWTSHWLTKDGCNSYYEGCDHCNQNEIITMKLNRNCWTVNI